jgi:hypothetical protein
VQQCTAKELLPALWQIEAHDNHDVGGGSFYAVIQLRSKDNVK